MKHSKLIAALVVFAMLSVSVAAIVTDNDDSRAANVENVKFGSIIGSEEWWLKATPGPEGSKTLYLTNTEDGEPCNIYWSEDEKEVIRAEYDHIVFGDGTATEIVIPEGCSYIDTLNAPSGSNEFVYTFFNSNLTLTIKGTLKMTYGDECNPTPIDLSMRNSNNFKLTVDGGTITAGIYRSTADHIDDGYFKVDLSGITSDAQSNAPFEMISDSNIHPAIKLSGSAHGILSTSSMLLGGPKNTGDCIRIENLYLENITVDVSEQKLKIRLYSDFINGPSVKFDDSNASDHESIRERVDSVFSTVDDKEHMFLGLFVNGMGRSIDYFGASIKDGVTADYVAVVLYMQQGVKEITTETGYDLVFLEVGKTYDLTKIQVTCIDKYSFDGWYYINEFSVMSKILNPTEFSPSESMNLFAVGVYTGGDTPEPGPTPGPTPTPTPSTSGTDYAPIIILGVFLAAIIALLAIVLVRRS